MALINHPLTMEEHISLITTIFSEYNQPKVGRSLSRVDYQAIVDIMDEVSTYVLLSLREGWVDALRIFGQALDSLTPQTRRRCLCILPKICGNRALLPKSLSLSYSNALIGEPWSSGGSADVWKGRYHDRDVALKVMRVFQSVEVVSIRRVSYHRISMFINKLTTSHTRGSAWKPLYVS